MALMGIKRLVEVCIVLVEAAQAACALTDPARRMRAAWEAGNVTAQDLIGAGK